MISEKIGLGGSCHRCTEALFQSLKGVFHVDQGWIASDDNPNWYSEAVVVEFDPARIALQTLVEIHLYTHSCTSDHSMRYKYRSAVYTFSDAQFLCANQAMAKLQANFDRKIITEVASFGGFRLNDEKYLNYYASNPEKPFCKTFIDPKLKMLLNQFSDHIDDHKLR